MLLFALPLIAAASDKQDDEPPFERTEQRQPCRDYDSLRRPHFGDLHVHTAWSFDASGQDTRNTPGDAYDFARGKRVSIQPYDEQGKGLRDIQIDRPLDFTAVTDHSEFMGEMRMCAVEGLPGYNHPVCLIHRHFPQFTQLLFGGYGLTVKRRWGMCGDDNSICLDAAKDTWQVMRDEAEDAYDRSEDCSFTSFIGYEWTATIGRGKNLHHNVIFRNDIVPDWPMSWIETPSQIQLWDYLEDACVDQLPGCDGIAIPHNTNLSSGIAFVSARIEEDAVPPGPVSREEAARRAHWNPLFEVMQHKGASECDNRKPVWAHDEFCDFELLPYDNFGTKNTGEDGEGVLWWMKKAFGGGDYVDIQPAGENSYLRYALKKGLQQQQELGANSFKYGLISSTDTHIAAPGLAMEKNHPGHGGAGMGSGEGVLAGLPDELEFNPGGFAVLYAEENSRDALFAAMRRREAYATSGTRPTLRFFGGWEYADDLCQARDMVARGYAGGAPMGGDLQEAPSADARPRFLLSALADAGTPDYPGTQLQRIQLVKGWYFNGELQERVMDVAGGSNDASVDIYSCEQSGPGHAQLCAVYEDLDFDPNTQAFYYARLLENPSCRWSQRLCSDAGVRCDDPATIPESMTACCSSAHQQVIQERAWSSPIWYTP
ncbi:MAG: DUF3604 domain-containing protein [Pseudomonadota bacterium]